MQPSPSLTRLILGNLFLIALSPLFSHDRSAAGQPPVAVRRYSLEVDQSVIVPISFPNSCARAVTFRGKREGKFISFEQQSILVPPGGARSSVKYDAAGLRPGNHTGAVRWECRDCKKMRCSQGQSSWKVELTVTAASSRAQDDVATREADAAIVKSLLNKDLERVAAAFEDRIKRLAVVKGRTPDDEEKEGYELGRVSAIFKDTEEQLLNALEREETQALQTYVKTHFPALTNLLNIFRINTERASAPPVANGFPTPPALRFRAAGTLPGETVIATVESARAAFKNVRGFIALVRSNSGPITLRVISEPEGANVEMRTAVRVKHTTSTNSDIQPFWPGTYQIKVAKDGFLPIEQEYEDLGFSTRVVECKLVPTGKSGTPILCQFR